MERNLESIGRTPTAAPDPTRRTLHQIPPNKLTLMPPNAEVGSGERLRESVEKRVGTAREAVAGVIPFPLPPALFRWKRGGAILCPWRDDRIIQTFLARRRWNPLPGMARSGMERTARVGAGPIRMGSGCNGEECRIVDGHRGCFIRERSARPGRGAARGAHSRQDEPSRLPAARCRSRRPSRARGCPRRRAR